MSQRGNGIMAEQGNQEGDAPKSKSEENNRKAREIAREVMKVQNLKMKVKCERCGLDAEVEWVPEGWDDEPEEYQRVRTCTGGCAKTYTLTTAQEVRGLRANRR